jgi:hypothetical protein
MCICNWNFTIFMLKLYMIYLNYSRLERLWKCKQNWKCNDSNVSASLHLMNSHETWSRHLPFRPPTAAINFTTDDTVSDRGFNVSIREVPFTPSICFKFSKINFNFLECKCPDQHMEFKNQSGDVTFKFPCHSMDCFWEIVPPKTVGNC